MKASGIIVAGGTGKRMGTETPKQLLKLDGVTIIERTLMPFIHCPDIKGIVIVAVEDSIEHIKKIIQRISKGGKSFKIVTGGTERQDSVWNGLKAVPEDTDIVVIHDAVRPFITSTLISDCIQYALNNGAVTTMRPIRETVKEVTDTVVIKTLDRSKLWITQTPQAFKKELILEAHRNARREHFYGTDDCMFVERLGYPVHKIEGTDLNIKITTPYDLKIAGIILSMFEKTED